MTKPAPAVPDYLASPNAIFNDVGVQWRYGRAPDYSKTRKVWEEGESFGPGPQAAEPLVLCPGSTALAYYRLAHALHRIFIKPTWYPSVVAAMQSGLGCQPTTN